MRLSFPPSLFAVPMLLIFFIQGLFLIRATSPTADEVAFHMVNGYAYLKTHDFRMSPANPPLAREWMALPWLLMKPKLDLEKMAWKEANSVPFAQEFFYKDNREIADRLLYFSRFMILLLGLGIGVVIFLWARSLYGDWGGVFSVSLYAFCPNFLAHSSIAHTDIAVSFCLLAASFYFWKYLETSKRFTLVVFITFFAMACATKYNALFFGPVFLFLILAKKGFSAMLKAGLWIAVAVFAVVWTVYFFEFKSLLDGGVPRADEKLGYIQSIAAFLFPHQEKAAEFLKDAALKTTIPIPSYILGLAGIIRSHRSPYQHYFLGELTTEIQWFYYLLCFFIKMTLPFLAAVALRAVFFKKCSSISKNESWVIVACVAWMFAITFFDSTAVGVRYLFPVIALLYVWVGGLVKIASASSLWRKGLVGLVILNTILALRVFPNYISYFNETVGGVEGGSKIVRGSDVDWGQGLKDLKAYLIKNRIKQVRLTYFGSADPRYYEIPYTVPDESERNAPLQEVYAISNYGLERFEWTLKTRPTARVGGSILIYDLRGPHGLD